jgi:hypothetical protein
MKAVILFVCAVLFASGCVIQESSPLPRGVVVAGPPPEPVREMRPGPPHPRAVWISGYWHWTGMQDAWIPGHWEQAPPPGARWHGPRYTFHDGAYYYEPGGWGQ